jgi:hypothetical protein
MLWLPLNFRRQDLSEGHFDLSSWEIHEHFTEEEHNRAIHTHGTLENDRVYPRQIHFPDEVLARDVGIIRTREHEWTHFRQHISTPHGIFLHRMCGLQEYLTSKYFEVLNENGLEYQRLPFHVMQHSETPSKARPFLMAWMAYELLRGALWGKTIEMEVLIAQWKTAIELVAGFAPLTAGDTKGAQLSTRRGAEYQSCPHGHLTVRDVSEGFAKFREFWIIAQFFGLEIATELVVPSRRDTYAYASDFIAHHLSVPAFHPFVGALLEVAMLSFEDPFMCDPDAPLTWEHIHPGMRLEETVIRLGSERKAIPIDPPTCYLEALHAFGMKGGLSNNAENWLRRSKGDVFTGNALPLVRDMQKYQRSTMLKAFRLRQECPGIYFFRGQKFDRKNFKVLRDISRPSVIINPDGIFLPWGWGRRPKTLALIIHATFCSHALEEISHHAELRHTVTFGRLSRRYLSKISRKDGSVAGRFSDANIKKTLLGYFGNCVSPLIDEALANDT